MTTDVPSPLARNRVPLRGHTVVVTGVSRRAGIGFATACRLAAYGANIFCQHYSPHDAEQPWGEDDVDAVLDEIRENCVGGARVVGMQADFSDPEGPSRVVEAATGEFGRLTGLVCNHAQPGSDGTLAEMSAAWLDSHWAVNTRASLLLAKAFAEHHRSGDNASIVFMTSGQDQGPMPAEIAYAASKAAIAGVTLTISHELAGQGIRVNTVNPGPVDTGYMAVEDLEATQEMFPFGRFGKPDDAARVIAWLLTPEAEWITGQVLNSEGGFTR